jgi:hypothetical protein
MYYFPTSVTIHAPNPNHPNKEIQPAFNTIPIDAIRGPNWAPAELMTEYTLEEAVEFFETNMVDGIYPKIKKPNGEFENITI